MDVFLAKLIASVEEPLSLEGDAGDGAPGKYSRAKQVRRELEPAALHVGLAGAAVWEELEGVDIKIAQFLVVQFHPDGHRVGLHDESCILQK